MTSPAFVFQFLHNHLHDEKVAHLILGYTTSICTVTMSLDTYTSFFLDIDQPAPFLIPLAKKEITAFFACHNQPMTMTTSSWRRHKILGHLHHILDPKLKSNNKSFVRLGSRSPKDAVLRYFHSSRSGDLENSELDRKIVEYHPRMAMRNADQAFTFLTQSTRVYEDITDKAYKHHCLCIFPWNEQIDPSREFRAFVFQGRLVAVCRALPTLLTLEFDEDKVKKAIATWFDKYKRFLPTPNAVMDLCLDVNTQNVIFIEFNPYSEITDAVCFDWEADADILYGEDKNEPTVYRFTEVHDHNDY